MLSRLHFGYQRLIELRQRLFRGPERHGVDSGQMRVGQGPPLFNIDHPMEVRLKSTEESGLPIEMVGEQGDHLGERFAPILEAQQFADKKMRASPIDSAVGT